MERKEFKDLTKEEFITLTKRKKYFMESELRSFLEDYQITIEEYIEFVRSNGLKIRDVERRVLTEHKKPQWDNEWKEMKFTLTDKIENVPDFVICALYDVSYEKIDGKRYYDQEELQQAKQTLKAKVRSYLIDEIEKVNRDVLDEDHYFCDLLPIDLVAMRMYRGYNRKSFSKIASAQLSDIVEWESKSSKVTKSVAKIYMKNLSIGESHIKKLRAVMNGEIDYIEENREIPKLIKLVVWKRDKGKCSECGSKNKLHYHHIKRFSDGGLHTKDNIKLLCAKCHAEEHRNEPSYHMLKKMAEG